MTHTFSPGEYKTRDGRKAVVLHVLNGGSHPLAGYVEDEDGRQKHATWANGGFHRYASCGLDLMPPPPPRVERWANVYSGYDGDIINGWAHESREYADRRNDGSRIGLLKLTIEGEGPSARVISAEVVDAP